MQQNMKKYAFLSILLIFATAALLPAQDLDKILDNHFKAIGQKNLEDVKTMKASGKLMSMGMEGPFNMVFKRPDKVRMNIDFQGTQIVQAYDGENAWVKNPMMGGSGAVKVTGDQADPIRESADMDGPLWNYKKKGYQLEVTGTEEVNGEEAYVLKLTKSDENVEHYYLDKDSYLITMARSSVNMNGMDMKVETLLSDYREVNGYKMPFRTEQRFGGQAGNTIIFDEVQVNVPVDDSIFDMEN
jgi:outer membrane lipoprotein-sorting protein